MSPPVYRFLPWARRGLAQGALGDDGIGTQGAHRLPARSTLPVALDVNGVPAGATVQLYGPGDVTGIDRRAILRSDPAPGATDFEPNYLVTVDFDPPDFPWMFTPARAVGDKLRPWCVLIVVERTVGVSIELQPGAVLPVLTIDEPADAKRELPDLDDSWAWAHAQVLEEAGSNPGNDLHVDLDVDPDRNLSRLICPRLLRPDTHYYAAVVPAFDHGVQRGLGDAPTDTTAGPAWDLATVETISLPLYHWFEFATAVADDVETMAKRLHGPDHAPPALGRRRVHAGSLAAGPAGADGAIVTMFGALRPAVTDTTVPMPAQDPGLTGRLTAAVAPRDTPQLPPPLYGEWPAATHELPTPPPPGWFAELNTTVAHRIAAGLGAEVVRRHQEAFVDAAWQQVGRIREANDLTGRAHLSAEVLRRVVARHVLPLPLDRMVQTVGPLLAGLRSPSTPTMSIVGELAASSVPTGATSAAFRRLASTQRQSVKRAMRTGAVQPGDGVVGLTAGGAGPAVVEPIRATPDGLVSLADRGVLEATAGADGSVSLAGLGLRGRTTMTALARLQPQPATLPTLGSGTVRFFPITELEPIIFHVTGRQVLAATGTTIGTTIGTAVIGASPERAPIGGQLRPPIGGLRPPRPDGPELPDFPDRPDRPIPDRPDHPIPDRPIPTRDPVPVPDADVNETFARAVGALAAQIDVGGPVAGFVGADVNAFAGTVLARLDPTVSVTRRVSTMISAPQRIDPFRGIMAFPILPEATYRFLDELGGGWMLPGADGLEPDTAILLQTNPSFTSAFLVGMNHEMDGELLWRNYPTDQQGTPFQRFWERVDGSVDIDPVHLWPDALPLATAGTPSRFTTSSATDAEGQIVLLLRGQLLRRYPNMVVYAVRGTHATPGTEVEPLGRPVFAGRLQPDLSLVGFSLTPQQLAADEWWFVLEQQLTAPRFGFDIGEAPTGIHVTVADLGPGVATADHVASALLQLPIRVAIHRDRLLLAGGGAT